MDREYLKEKWKPIADGLFGKQRLPSYEKPHYRVRELAEMLPALLEIPLPEWRGYMFSREPLNGKLTEEQRILWIEKAYASGRDAAERWAEKAGSRKPAELAAFLKMQVEYPRYPDKTDRVLFADFREPNQIRIFTDALLRAEKHLKKPEIQALLGEGFDPQDILLGHELFHYVEEQEKDTLFSRTEKIRLWTLGPLHNDSGLIALSEIAAMGFTAALNELKIPPYIMDVLLVYDYSPEEASGLYEEMMELSGRSI